MKYSLYSNLKDIAIKYSSYKNWKQLGNEEENLVFDYVSKMDFYLEDSRYFLINEDSYLEKTSILKQDSLDSIKTNESDWNIPFDNVLVEFASKNIPLRVGLSEFQNKFFNGFHIVKIDNKVRCYACISNKQNMDNYLDFDSFVLLQNDSFRLFFNEIFSFKNKTIIVGNKPTFFKSKKAKNVRKIVYCLIDKKYVSKFKKLNPDFEYSHRFEVMGHWRKISCESLGKNRNGDYIVRGYTWVKDFVKGSCDKPIIVKPRVFVSTKDNTLFL